MDNLSAFPHQSNDGAPQREDQPLSVLRAEVVERLKLNYAYDNINDHELGLRIEQAEAGRTHTELRMLVADLPLFHEPGTSTSDAYLSDPTAQPQTTAQPKTRDASVELNSGRVGKSSTVFALLGGAERRGVWRPARSTRVVAVMGGVDLDYRKAIFPPGRTVVNALCIMGGLDIIVPPGVAVEVSAVPILGGVDNRTDTPEDPSAPVLEIRAVAIMGGVDIKTKKAKG
ncbi:MAG: DUF1707 and DUF2154 domain-containing protein [Spirochaetaceae bacterium]|nr:MAG: DUF1707 and DUF2154 domain-containing protein [Spirochaetaceae bacterium]